MLNLVVAEASLETVPTEILNHPQIQKYAKKHGKEAKLVLLDKSYHFEAMSKLKNKEKRGRPDITHFILLEALGSPLNLEGMLRVYVHTLNNFVIQVKPETRLPKNYNRFVGLIEQLFEAKKVPVKGEPLLTLRRLSLKELLEKIKPTYVVALTRLGEPQTLIQTAKKLAEQKNPVVLVGGFPHGHFSNQTLKLANEKISIDPSGLDAWIVVSRILSAYEIVIGLPEKRLNIKR
jgi:rRNA small subunit pseudouridine methyltransferase Nep1